MQSTIDELLLKVRSQLALDTETQRDLLDELRTHLDDAIEQASSTGLDHDHIVQDVVARFDPETTATELQEVHAGWGTADAVIAAALPVLCALVLRWLVFAPDGTAIGWHEVLVRPAFWVVAAAALIVPLLKLERWRYGLVSWAFFWMVTVLSTVLPSARW